MVRPQRGHGCPPYLAIQVLLSLTDTSKNLLQNSVYRPINEGSTTRRKTIEKIEGRKIYRTNKEFQKVDEAMTQTPYLPSL